MILSSGSVAARGISASFRLLLARDFDLAAAACDAEGRATEKSTEYMSLPWVLPPNGTASRWQDYSNTANSVARMSEALAYIIMSAALVIFFPICIVMFRRVERRLASVMSQMDHRPDRGFVLLPYEFSPTPNRFNCSENSSEHQCEQIEMQIGQAREFLDSLLSAAAVQRRRFTVTCSIAMVAFFGRALYASLRSYAFLPSPRNFDCQVCQPCQIDRFLMRTWFTSTPELDPLVTSLTSAPPLVMLLWLMLTKEDRMQLLSNALTRKLPSKILLNEHQMTLTKHRVRMGIDLKAGNFD